MKFFTKKEVIPLFVIFLMLIAAVSFYKTACLPGELPTHWNAQGEVDSWAGKNFVLFFFPALTLGFYLLVTFLPLIDPLRENYKKFVLPYFLIRLFFVLLFAFLYSYTLWTALGTAPKINLLIIPFFALFFVVLGLIMPKLKRNYFVGIRTPWTLHSEIVWDKTHRLAGFTFVTAGFLSFFSVFLGQYGFGAFLVLILTGAFLPVLYSCFLYKKFGLFKGERRQESQI